VAFWKAPNGHPRAISSSGAGMIGVWNLRTGEKRFLTGHQDWVRAVALSADSRHALSGHADRTLLWWDLERGLPLKALAGHQGGVLAVALSADGRHALSGSRDDTIRLWDLASGQCRACLPCPHEVSALALAPDNRTVAAGLSDGRVLFFHIEER
jgi:WD40 repeat protein